MLLTEKRTERIDLGDGDWVDILLSLDTRQAAIISDLNAQRNGALKMVGLLEVIVDAWSSDLPIAENVGHLAPEASAKIMQVFNERVRVPDPKASSSRSTSSSRRKAPDPMKT